MTRHFKSAYVLPVQITSLTEKGKHQEMTEGNAQREWKVNPTKWHSDYFVHILPYKKSTKSSIYVLFTVWNMRFSLKKNASCKLCRWDGYMRRNFAIRSHQVHLLLLWEKPRLWWTGHVAGHTKQLTEFWWRTPLLRGVVWKTETEVHGHY